MATPEGEKHVEVSTARTHARTHACRGSLLVCSLCGDTQVDPTLPVEQITRTICEALGIKPDQLAAGGDTQRGFSLTVQSEDEESIHSLACRVPCVCRVVLRVAAPMC